LQEIVVCDKISNDFCGEDQRLACPNELVILEGFGDDGRAAGISREVWVDLGSGYVDREVSI
jgi:hypothetical protein